MSKKRQFFIWVVFTITCAGVIFHFFGSSAIVKANPAASNNSLSNVTYAYNWVSHYQTELVTEWKSLESLEVEYAMLGVQWDENAEDMAENAINAGNAVSLDVLTVVTGIIMSTANTIKDMADAHALAVALVNKALEIQSQNADVGMAVSDRDSAYDHYKAHYDAYVAAYSGSIGLIPKGSTPTDVSVGDISISCKNVCGTSYSSATYGLSNIVTLAEGGSAGGYTGHLVTCSIPLASRALSVRPSVSTNDSHASMVPM